MLKRKISLSPWNEREDTHRHTSCDEHL